MTDAGIAKALSALEIAAMTDEELEHVCTLEGSRECDHFANVFSSSSTSNSQK